MVEPLTPTAAMIAAEYHRLMTSITHKHQVLNGSEDIECRAIGRVLAPSLVAAGLMTESPPALRAFERYAIEAILDRPFADPDDNAAIAARAALRLAAIPTPDPQPSVSSEPRSVAATGGQLTAGDFTVESLARALVSVAMAESDMTWPDGYEPGVVVAINLNGEQGDLAAAILAALHEEADRA